MDPNQLEKEFHVSRFIIIYKFILGVLELILGLGVWIFGDRVLAFFTNYKAQELSDDPHDLLVTLLEKIIPFILEHKGYIIIILLLLGIVKIVGSIGLFYKKHWGLDLLVGLTVFLLPLDLYELFLHPTWPNLVYFIINILIALYLVEFNPKGYFTKFKSRVRKTT